MRFWVLALLAAVSSSAGMSAAAKKQGPAPVKKEAVRIWGYAADQYRSEITDRDAARQSGVIARTGAKKGDPSTWLPPSDPAFALLKRNPKLQAEAKLLIAFDANGKSDLCVVTSQTGSATLIDGICDRLRPRAQIALPMTRDGQKFPVNLNLVVEFAGVQTTIAPTPIFAPPPPPNWWNGKPPAYVENVLKISGMPIVRDLATVSPDAASTGITVRLDAGRPTRCIVGRPFRDTANSDRACELALKASYPTEKDAPPTTFLPILFVGSGEQMAALVPRFPSERSAKIRSGVRMALETLVTKFDANASLKPVVARLLVDKMGGAIDCWLTAGSGSDQADLKICEYLMDGRHFDPGLDIYGRPSDTSIYHLDLGEPPR